MDEWIKKNGVIFDPPNQRIKIMNVQSNLLDPVFLSNLHLAEAETGFTKTIIYSKKGDVDFFLNHGFHQEGKIDGFFKGQNAYILTKFQCQKRANSKVQSEEDQVVKLAEENYNQAKRKPLEEKMLIRKAELADAEQISALFRTVFATYPTPVHEPSYIKKVMQEDTCFMVIELDKQIISIASAEVTPELCCAEMTDCATHPSYRGQSLLSHLFFSLEAEMDNRGIDYLFSLTRAQSPAMNITVAKHGYQYRGRLVNNCDIFSGFEDMNIWVKSLGPTWD